jgi:hypothetical protein
MSNVSMSYALEKLSRIGNYGINWEKEANRLAADEAAARRVSLWLKANNALPFEVKMKGAAPTPSSVAPQLPPAAVRSRWGRFGAIGAGVGLLGAAGAGGYAVGGKHGYGRAEQDIYDAITQQQSRQYSG